MTKIFIAASTALAIALGSFTAVGAASAAPLGISSGTVAEVQTADAGVETVRRRRHWHGRRAGTAAAIGLGAFALGAAVAAGASQARPVRECYVERTKRWSPRRGAYVITKQRVCY